LKEQEPTAIERATLAGVFHSIGLREGGTVLVHSSLSSLGYVDGGEETVIDSLLDVLGPTGLLVMPTHTWDTVSARQPVFHETLSPSRVGRISEALRHRPGAVRSLHPTHSVVAVGPSASTQRLCEGHHLQDTPCAIDSPYGRLVDRRAQALMIGVGLESFTMMHAFEEWAHLPWLFNRIETLYVITRTGVVHTVAARRHTDERRYKERDFPSLEPLLVSSGAIAYAAAGQATVRLVELPIAKETIVPLLEKAPDAVLGPNRHWP
jgi:aminoglycoside 3-N-acetyltransferase